MRIRPVVELLTAAAGNRRIEGALRFAADMEAGQFTRDWYVLPLRRADGENGLVNAHRQRRKHRFGVVIAARSVNTPSGADTLDDIEDAIECIANALVGVTLPGHDDAISAAGGALLQFKGGVALWQEDFETTTQFRRV